MVYGVLDVRKHNLILELRNSMAESNIVDEIHKCKWHEGGFVNWCEDCKIYLEAIEKEIKND